MLEKNLVEMSKSLWLEMAIRDKNHLQRRNKRINKRSSIIEK